MAERIPWEQPLYRFAAVLVGDAAAARQATRETLAAVAKKAPGGDADRLAISLYHDLRRRILKAPPAARMPAPAELPEDAARSLGATAPEAIEAALHDLPEPGRSGLALLLLDVLGADEIAKLLGLTPAELGAHVSDARARLHRTLTGATRETAA